MLINQVQDSGRIKIINLLRSGYHVKLKRDIRLGLTAHQKFVPSKYFYDERGCRLFDDICALPEYYQTRAELSILKDSSSELVRDLRNADIIELGSGANLKIRLLLDAAFMRDHKDICYVPVDVSEPTLLMSSVELINSYPDLRVTAVVSDFTCDIINIYPEREKLFVFFGSTIGNFSSTEGELLLRKIADLMKPSDRFVLGVDMVKPIDILERSYNDSQGVTAEFNKNILNVLNRELNADFDPSFFDHIAFYNGEQEQIEMHLRANCDFSAEIRALGMKISLKRGETIQTEICRKFSRESLYKLVENAGLRIHRWYSDDRRWFSLLELVRIQR